MKRAFWIVFVGLFVVVTGIFLGFQLHIIGNKIEYTHEMIDNQTNYEILKTVEDTCRAMKASYEADKVTYELYNGSTDKEKQSWAEQARMRANRTASTYNEYILKNKYIWSGNVPIDIAKELIIIG